MYGATLATDFGPLALKAVREKYVAGGLARTTTNQNVGRIVRMFTWAAAQEMIPASVPAALRTVAGLRRGRCDARETAAVKPDADAIVDATPPHLPAVVADMVRVHRLTGARPSEVCELRPCDIDRSGDVWLYRSASHKTEHHDRGRVIFIGPKAQAILTPYLDRPADQHCFRPVDSEGQRLAARHAARKTPLSCGNRPGSRRKRSRLRPAGEAYTRDSYGRAVARACLAAFRHPTLSGRKPSGLSAAERAELTTWQK